jgi:type VII secretion-associated serine protease mycosin
VSRALIGLLALVVFLSAVPPAAANTDPEPPKTPVAGEIIPGEVVVKWRDAKRAPEVARARGLSRVAEVGAPGEGLAAEVVATGGRPLEAVIAELAADPAVEYAEPNYVVSLATVTVNDPQTASQYSLDHMRVRDAWNHTTGANNVVAVLDTGVQANHPDLAGRVLPGYNFVSSTTNASDDNGHGTWVAGIIAANTNNGRGIAGISWSDKILPVKIMGSNGTGSTSNLTSGIVWAANNGAHIINMSVGGFPYSKAVEDAVNYAWGKGAVLVGAAGNNNRREDFYPASYANVVSVSATQMNDEFSHWSSYGPKVEVSAPGSSILTTNCTVSPCVYATSGETIPISGTSFATPNVAGVLALIKARYPSFTPSQLVARLYETVDDLGYPGRDELYGRGRVNALRAMGVSVPQVRHTHRDAWEANDGIGSARTIAIGATTSPTLYPAGDVDWFAVDVPRAGRLDVRVTGVVDNRAFPWNRSSLPIDPIVELYTAGGDLIVRVDNEWESGVELAQAHVSGPTRILVRIWNYYANGSTTPYTVTPTYVDTVPPTVVARAPGPNATGFHYDGSMTVDFSEAVTGVGPSTVLLQTSSGATVPAAVTYAASQRRATVVPASPLAPEASYRIQLTSGIKDLGGLSLAGTNWSFTTGKALPRIAGADRYATSASVSATYAPGVPVVFVATGSTFPDALAAGPAAHVLGGPLLLVTSKSIPSATAAELTRLRPGRIVVAGGSGVVSDAVLQSLRSYTTGTVTRQAGADRYETAAQISRSSFAGGAGTVYVATGQNFPDALALGAVAARTRAPILLTRTDTLPKATVDELKRLKPSSIVLAGGTGAVSDAVMSLLRGYAPTVTRISGADRYATSVGLSSAVFGAGGPKTVYLATGRNYPDGLSAGPLAGVGGGPLLLVESNRLPGSIADELRRLNPSTIVIIGGSGAISDSVREAIRALWK